MIFWFLLCFYYPGVITTGMVLELVCPHDASQVEVLEIIATCILWPVAALCYVHGPIIRLLPGPGETA